MISKDTITGVECLTLEMHEDVQKLIISMNNRRQSTNIILDAEEIDNLKSYLNKKDIQDVI